MGGFCRYCGEIASRCRCLSGRPSSVESKTVQALRDSGAGMLAKDRWSSRYTLQRKSHDSNIQQASPSSSRPASRPPLPARSQRSFTTTPSSPPPSTEAEMEAFLSHSFGSVLDPREEQAKWRCAACQTPFHRDATLYPTDEPTQFYCKACFAARKSKGACGTCGKAVLGDVSFVAREKEVWHSSCASCSYCSTNVSESPTVDLTGKLCCDVCFVSLAWKKTTNSAASSPASSPTKSPEPTRSSPGSPLRPISQRKNLNPAVEALRKNFSTVGLEAPREETPPPLASPQMKERPPSIQASTGSSSPVKPEARRPLPEPPTRQSSPEKQPVRPHSTDQSAVPSTCRACRQSLFSIAQHGSKVIKLHDGSTYHSGCFVCAVCQKGFAGLQYAIESDRPVHSECAPEPEPIFTPLPRPSPEIEPRDARKPPPHALPRSKPLPIIEDTEPRKTYIRPKYHRQQTSPLPVLSKLGKGPTCATCLKAITFLDRKVSAGGMEWHERCCACATCGMQLASPRVVDGLAKCINCRFGSPSPMGSPAAR